MFFCLCFLFCVFFCLSFFWFFFFFLKLCLCTPSPRPPPRLACRRVGGRVVSRGGVVAVVAEPVVEGHGPPLGQGPQAIWRRRSASVCFWFFSPGFFAPGCLAPGCLAPGFVLRESSSPAGVPHRPRAPSRNSDANLACSTPRKLKCARAPLRTPPLPESLHSSCERER